MNPDQLYNCKALTDLKFELNAGARLAHVYTAEPLKMSVETASEDLGVTGLDGLDERVVDEDVLVLGLYHVVAL